MRDTSPRKDTNRMEKVNSLIQHILGQTLLPYLKNQNGLTTITKVDTSRDMKWAKVWISVVGEDEKKIMKTLQNNIYDIQGELYRTMSMKIVPKISFHLDSSAQYAEHINEIFREIEHEQSDATTPKNE